MFRNVDIQQSDVEEIPRRIHTRFKTWRKFEIKIYRTIIFPTVLYGCETWSLSLREERRLRVFENRVLRRILGPKGDEVKGEWRKLHNEELNDLYSSLNIILTIKSRRMRWVGHVARKGGENCLMRSLMICTPHLILFG